MEGLVAFFVKFVSEVGAILLVPVILIILALVVRMGIKAAIRTGLLTGVALVGIYTILGLFLNSLQPVAEAIANRFEAGLKLTYIDIGWPACFAAGVALPIAISYVLIGIVINLILVIVGWVKTLSIEMVGPIMGEGIIGYIVYSITGNFWYGLIAASALKIIILLLADWQAPMGEEFFGFEGISLIQTGVNEWGLLGWPISKLLDKISFFKKPRFTSAWVTEKFGVFGEPMFLGVIFGIGLGLLAKYSWSAIAVLCINLAASLNILPRMIGILMEGLVPVMRGLGDWLQKNAKGREIYIGMDPALGVGHPAVLSTVMIMIPITIIIAVILPGNKVLPLGDLATLVFTFLFLVVMNKGDILRSVITCIIVVPILLWLTTLGAPYINRVLIEAKIVEASSVSSVCMFEGGQPYWYPFAKLAELIGK